MAMTPRQAIAFHLSQAEDALQSLSSPSVAESPHLTALNQNEVIKGLFTAALYSWRMRLPSTRDRLQRVLIYGDQLLTNPKHRLSGDDLPRVRLEIIFFCKLLLGESLGSFTITPLTLSATPKRRTDPTAATYRFLDYCLLQRLSSRPSSDETTQKVFSRLQAELLPSLVTDTYSVYFRLFDDIKSRMKDDSGIEKNIRKAGELYTRRRTDDTYGGSFAYEGGGEYNDRVIDFRLGTILSTDITRTRKLDGIIDLPHFPFFL